MTDQFVAKEFICQEQLGKNGFKKIFKGIKKITEIINVICRLKSKSELKRKYL